MKISIIGVGRLGGALALALARKGYSIENLVARRRETAERIAENINPKPRVLSAYETAKLGGSEIIFITVQDSEIEAVAANLARSLAHKPFVFHTSGSLSSRILSDLSEAGCCVGSIHPLVSVSDSFLGADGFGDVFFCLEGDSRAVALAEKIVADLQGRAFTVETRFKTLYHA
ncbi:MAG: NAD(P)-binding domain-containing protein, partial [Acidobacteriota bacterium]|nr:NAD(P)-binding domain-containing protein [Acidobacteriota bacterium]